MEEKNKDVASTSLLSGAEEEPHHFDPFTLEVLWSRAIAIADEMAATLIRTAFSTIIRVNYDFACGIFDETGELVAQASNCAPGQLGCMPTVMKDMLKIYPADTLAPGDVLVTNDPWIGSGHSSDIFVASPIFLRDRLVGLTCNSAHHMDVGGTLTADARDVHEEGLLIPVSKLYTQGDENDMLVRLLKQNVRFPEKTMGDLRAQLAANHVGSERVGELIKEQKLPSLRPLAEAITDRTSTVMRSALRQIPDGEYQCRYELEERDRAGRALQLSVRIVIADGEVLIDYTGTSDQVDRPINCVFNYTMSYSVLGLKMALCPDLPYSAGIQQPITVTVPDNNLLNAEYPSAVWWRTTIGQLVPELIFMALAQAIPEHVVAGCGSVPMWIYFLRGKHADGRSFHEGGHEMGGLGARFDKDGLNTVAFPSNIAGLPTEILEAETRVLLVEGREYAVDSGGAGKCRGGLGQKVRFKVLSESSGPVFLSISRGRHSAGPVGLLGGRPGSQGAVHINGRPLAFEALDAELQPHDQLTLEIPGGGGMHDPRYRQLSAVEEDVRQGYVSVAAAKEEYGVVVDPSSLAVDVAGTEALRKAGSPFTSFLVDS